MVVVLCLGIILAISVPSFINFYRSNRVAGDANTLMGNIHYARSLAVRERKTFHIEFTAGKYEIKETATDEVRRTVDLADGVTCTASADPSFFAWGLADPVTITVDGGTTVKNLVLSANGHVGY